MRLHELLKEISPQFPVIGVEGYGGEQDGNNTVFAGVITVASRHDCEERFGEIEIPKWLQVHYCRRKFAVGCGMWWELSLAYWPENRGDDEIPAGLDFS